MGVPQSLPFEEEEGDDVSDDGYEEHDPADDMARHRPAAASAAGAPAEPPFPPQTRADATRRRHRPGRPEA